MIAWRGSWWWVCLLVVCAVVPMAVWAAPGPVAGPTHQESVAVAQMLCTPRILTTSVARAGADVSKPPTEGWGPVVLPDNWAVRWPDLDGTVWYRIDWELPCPPSREVPVGLALDGMSMAGEVFVNDELLWRSEAMVEPMSRHWNLPLRWMLPVSILQVGTNTVWVRVQGQAVSSPGLAQMHLGPWSEVESLYSDRLWRQRTVYQISLGLSAAVCSVFFMVWLLHRRESAYGWYAFMSMCWVIYLATILTTGSWPFKTSLAMSRANIAVFLLYALGFCKFTWHFGAQNFPRLERALWPVVGVSLLSVLLVPLQWALPVFAGVWIGSVLVYFFNCVQFPFHAWRTRNTQHAWLALCWLFFAVMSMHDFLLVLRKGPAHESWSAVAGPIATVFMSVLLGGRLVGSMRRIERFNHELEEGVSRARQELALVLERNHRQALEHARLQERVDISHDLHDGLGSSLVRSMALVEQTPQPLPNHKVMSLLKVLRDDLRQVIDSGSSAGVVLPASPLLWAAPVRHRFTRIFDEMDVTTMWSMPPQWVRPPSALQCMALTRLLEEALSNVIKHSQATRVVVQCIQPEASALQLRIEDNGVGFDVQAVAGAGLSVGMRSMHARMARVDGQLRVTSSPGATVLEVRLVLAPISAVAAAEGGAEGRSEAGTPRASSGGSQVAQMGDQALQKT